MRMKFTMLVLIFVSIATLVGAESLRYTEEVFPPLPKDQEVAVITSGQEERPYKIIGQVTTEIQKFSSNEIALKTLKKDARKMGGHAILNLQHSIGTSGMTKVGDSVSFSQEKYFVADVAVFTDQR